MTGSIAERRRILRLIAGVTRRFWPLVKTRNRVAGGALWPVVTGVGERMRAILISYRVDWTRKDYA